MDYLKKLIALLAAFSMFSLHAEKNSVDYVVVGVGTAGATVAKKLTDDHCTSVVALHNGKNLTKDPLIKCSKNAIFTVLSAALGSSVPIDPLLPPDLQTQIKQFFALLSKNSHPLYINGETPPQSGADDRELLWALALPEGGASSINAGAWCRGTNQVYSIWEAIAGPNWSVRQINKIYKELENYHGNTLHPFFRGFNGPISIRAVPASKLARKFTRAIIETADVPYVLDYNDPRTPIGASTHLQLTQRGKNGACRVSSATAFLNETVMTPSGHGVNGRKLRVLFESTALNVIWEGNKAVGVTYQREGRTKKVYAKKGIIVCAGLFSSSFLMHSGIGPRSLLQSLNIPVVFDNPNVGQNLADQTLLLTAFASNPKDAPGPDANSIFASISWLPAPGGDPRARAVRFSTTNQIPGITFGLLDLVEPKSRGSITINSSNPLDPPVINFGILSNPQDLSLYQAALQIYIKGINEKLQVIDPSYQLIFPDPAILDDASLVAAFVEETVMGNQCYQSHCLMAPFNQGGVVDSEGRVYGVKNLLVADDSIAPYPMDGTPMASAYLIGANIVRMLQKQD